MSEKMKAQEAKTPLLETMKSNVAEIAAYGGLAVTFVLFLIFSGSKLAYNFSAVLQAASAYSIIALGAVFVYSMGFMDVSVGDEHLHGNGFKVALTPEEKDLLKDYVGKEIVLGVRPENVVEGGETIVKVSANENLGMNTQVHGHVGKNSRITCKLKGWLNYKQGDEVHVTFTRKHFFDKETTNAIRKEAKA